MPKPTALAATLVAGLVLVLVGVLGWLVMSDAPGPGIAVAVPEESPQAEAAVPETPGGRERVGRTRGTGPSEQGADPPADRATPDTAALAGRVIVVVGGPTGNALPGVAVAFLEVSDPKLEQELEDLGGSGVARVFREGRTVVTGSDGRTRIGAVTQRAIVAARCEFGEALAWAEVAVEGELALRIQPRTDLRVRVVDEAGAPVPGIDVVLAARSKWDDQTLARSRTDEQGETTLVALAPPPNDERLFVTTAAPFAQQPEAEILRTVPPPPVIELRLPPSGSVVCEIVDQTGKPAGDGELVVLRRRPGPDFGDLDDDRHFSLDEHIHARAVVRGGRATFPRVGISLELQARLSPRGGLRVTTDESFAGPTEAGDETRVRVLFGPLRPAVIGRVVTPAGEPVPDFHLFGRVLVRDEVVTLFRNDLRVVTGADGRFHALLDQLPTDVAGHQLQLGRKVDLPTGSYTVREFLTVDVPAQIPPAGANLGDLVFAGGAVLVSGRVVDAAGEPLEGVTLAVMDDQRRRRGTRRDTEIGRSDADGRFELHGDVDAEELRLGASLDGQFLAEPVVFLQGATDVQVRMSVAGGIAGSVLRGATTDRQLVAVVLRGMAQEVHDAETRFREGTVRLTLDDDGGFRIGSLRPGTARLEVWLGWNENESVLAVDDIVVTAGQVTRDPRLQGIDLRQYVKSYELRVIGANEEPVEGAVVNFRKAGGDAYWDDAPTGPDGVIVLASRFAALDLVVTHRDHVALEVLNVTADRTIRLAPGKKTIVTVRMKPGAELPAPPFEVQPTLTWLGPLDSTTTEEDDWGDPRSAGDFSPFTKSREVSFAVLAPGRYRVTAMLWKSTISSARGSDIATTPAAPIVTIPGDGRPITVEIALDAKELAKRSAEEN